LAGKGRKEKKTNMNLEASLPLECEKGEQKFIQANQEGGPEEGLRKSKNKMTSREKRGGVLRVQKRNGKNRPLQYP